MTVALIALGVVIALTVVIALKAAFGKPADLHQRTKFEEGWLKLLDKVDRR